jgi:hypothetical protein
LKIIFFFFFFFKEKKARIVFVNFDTLSRPIFFCEVYRTFKKELRERYVWILTENDYHLWNFSINNCTKKEILDATNGHIIIDSSFERKPSIINPKRVCLINKRLVIKDLFFSRQHNNYNKDLM